MLVGERLTYQVLALDRVVKKRYSIHQRFKKIEDYQLKYDTYL